MEDSGLDFSTLTLREDMRFWASSGVSHILCDEGVDVFAVPRETASWAASSSGEAQRLEPPRKKVVSAPKQRWADRHKTTDSLAKPEKQSHPAKEQPVAASVASPRAASNTGRSCEQTQTSERQVVAETPAELAVYPYEEFRKKIRIPSRTIWTYWELGNDFGQQPSDERRDLFKRIIHFLKWPPGSVGFWPLTFEHKGQLISQPGQFWKGVREAQARSVMIFGEEAFKCLFPRQPYKYGWTAKDSLSVLVLPGPGKMLAGDKQAKSYVWNTLRNHRP